MIYIFNNIYTFYIVLIKQKYDIIITALIAREIGQKYNIVPKRLVSLIDIFALIVTTCITIQFRLLRTAKEKESY